MITNLELFQKYMQFRKTMHRHGKEGCIPPMGMPPVHPPMHGPHGPLVGKALPTSHWDVCC